MIKDWDIFIKLINDRNSKFILDFWNIVFKQCETFLNLTTVYHSSIDKQAKRTNQTIKIALRCFFVKRYEKNWQNILFHVKYVLNILKNVFMNISFFEILYDVKSRDSFAAIICKNVFNVKTNFLKKRKQIKLNIIDSIQFAQIWMIILFDKKHKSFDITNKSIWKWRQSNNQIIRFLKQILLSRKNWNHSSLKKINSLIYEFNFLFKMKMHSIISIIHLKQAKKDFYEKKVAIFKIFDSESILIQKKPHYVIKKILNEKSKNDLSNFMIK